MGGNQNMEHDLIVKMIRAKLEALGCFTLHLQSFTRRKIGRRIVPIKLAIEKGWPDVICIKPDGSVSFYEVKTGEAVLNNEQRRRFKELAERNTKIYIVHDRTLKTEVFKWRKD